MAIKRVLITGSNSYVGTTVEKWLMKEPDKFYVETISVRGDAWKSFDFSKFDVVFHVAALVHKKSNIEFEQYLEVNALLPVELVQKLILAKVKHFIFISTMAVYGITEGEINSQSPIIPKTKYGKSKRFAEKLLTLVCKDSIQLTIIRPPLIIGYKSPGNYTRLAKFLKLFPFFPYYENKKSLLRITDLTKLISLIIECSMTGFFHPQSLPIMSTPSLINQISKSESKKIYFVKFFNPIIALFLRLHFPPFVKIFSSNYYSSKLSTSEFEEEHLI